MPFIKYSKFMKISRKIDFLLQILKKFSNIKFCDSSTSGSKVVAIRRQMRRTKL